MSVSNPQRCRFETYIQLPALPLLRSNPKTYPVDDWERERNTRIVRWQGRGNPWVTEPAKLKVVCG